MYNRDKETPIIITYFTLFFKRQIIINEFIMIYVQKVEL